jgi:hypothetical protein
VCAVRGSATEIDRRARSESDHVLRQIWEAHDLLGLGDADRLGRSPGGVAAVDVELETGDEGRVIAC